MAFGFRGLAADADIKPRGWIWLIVLHINSDTQLGSDQLAP